MSEPPIPKAQIASPLFRFRSIVRPILAIGRFLKRSWEGVLVIALIAGLGTVCSRACQSELRKKEKACLENAGTLEPVERLVRDVEGLRVYVSQSGSPVLWEKRMPIHVFSTVAFQTDVPADGRMWVTWSSKLNQSEQCETQAVVHLRSARDIE
jgi:hypothetical protein